jgi:1,4-alpha-glucan branching enzyme
MPDRNSADFPTIAGAFNDWKPIAYPMDGTDPSGSFETKLVLAKGVHEYKFVLDGTRWRQDAGNCRQAGYYHNSVIEVGAAR